MKNTKLIGAVALLASLVSGHALADSEQKKLTLMLDWFVNPNHGPIVIAQERGYFAEQGLDVEIQEPADPSTPAKLVAAGKVDLAVTYQPSLTMDVAAGLPLVRASTLIATPLNTLMVLDNGRNDSLADLKGKKIGIAIAGNEEATIGTMLAQENVAFTDVQTINVGWALSSSLASGKVDAIWGGLRNFETNQLALEGFKAKAFFPEEHGVPAYDELIFVANAKQHDDEAIKAFNKALEQATTYIVNHPQESWSEFVAYSPDTLNNELNQRAWNDTLTRFALRPSAVDLKRYDDYAQFMFDKGIIKTLPKAESYVPVFN
ncbi:ABC transporter substrate-binding protein [Vibrio crassostreae]|uniref:ABC transporter substrate-binding protein n=1 Tax=Vibrio crassostreae TaxID=246167 RepID=UPI001051DD0C|nr:ABC transporter substrate-binding protein [Vibrio crassostreae]TCO01821.1 putative hydroxymethylpyrimidine transport system substrate-binding protein [Vibrio crassostreae]CAK2038311.1 putative thiamine biosynthesis protein HI_0357 [Vibrio crassostreae]CAK2075201.1 putative thiamine biosynthesis protein HI_0357 [Vibrio crassostreae]CAK2081031.1 putative thiamine biosynthesis protein HI_0357 [Vibrio crassostreae]CAK2859844.1 putative thiamine biosynthesis protein HI_0357 [Vibrio crassostreae]